MTVRYNSHTKDWTRNFFIKYPQLYLPILESMKSQSQYEVEKLDKIFQEWNVPTGSKILDLSCGIGRHSIYLAKKGYQVVGYDISAFYLQRAKVWAAKVLTDRLERVRFYQGDVYKAAEVLSRHGESCFDAIIIMFNSLGYSGEHRDVQMLKGILKVAAKNCILITETDNRDWWFGNFQPSKNLEYDKLEVHQTWKLDPETSVAQGRWKFYEKIGKNKNLRLIRDLPSSLRLYSLHEVIRIINSSGWKYLRSYGGTGTSEPVSHDSRDILSISQKLIN
jgi:SAM-dependent methyltransferase